MNQIPLGAHVTGKDACSFNVWAPRCETLTLRLFRPEGVSDIPMTKDDEGYFTVEIPDAKPGLRYCYVLPDGAERPDPAAYSLPDSVHGICEVAAPDAFRWTDKRWRGTDLKKIIFYELHVGTFTPEGTFAAAIAKIPYLKKLGITCVEVMPVARFPGERNWGYDGVGLFAVQPSYGGRDGLKAFVNACHANGLAVCLDVVYNHLGPEGNYLREFGFYFTSDYHVPWGEAVNFDGWESGHVRRFFLENARYWIREFHIDALRLDAVHAIYDFSARHILREINDAVEDEGRRAGRVTLVIAESDLNDSRLIRPVAKGGYGLAGQWSDDFHHAVHAHLTGERGGYYLDFGSLEDIVTAMGQGFVYDGKYSKFRHRRHGDQVKDLPPEKLVVAIQNHDQVGNRALGDRFGTILSFEARKLAASLLLLSVNTPLIFMGDEYGEKRPFQYFVDHGDEGLARAVREGRKKEFASFGWTDVPDPNAEATFLASKLDWDALRRKEHTMIFRLYQDLIALRKKYFFGERRIKKMFPGRHHFALEYLVNGRERLGAVFFFGKDTRDIPLLFKTKRFTPLFCSGNVLYGGKMKKFAQKDGKILGVVPMSAALGKLS